MGADSLQIQLTNPVKGPLRFFISSDQKELNQLLIPLLPLKADPEATVQLSLPIVSSFSKDKASLYFISFLGGSKPGGEGYRYPFCLSFPKRKILPVDTGLTNIMYYPYRSHQILLSKQLTLL